MRFLLLAVVIATAAGGFTQDAGAPVADENQLEAVRDRIRQFEDRLASIERDAETTLQERERLQVEVDLAQARVREVELALTSSRDEIVQLKGETSSISRELEDRRTWLSTHVELVALLGMPGPLQLIWDGTRGGHLEDSFGVVVTLTAGQARIVQEYEKLQAERATRQAELSRILERAGREMTELAERRNRFETARRKLDRRLARLKEAEQSAASRLEEMQARERALERLIEVVGRKERLMAGQESITRYRGALPWPSEGRVVRTFGRHYEPRYATYTVCNGLRLTVESGTPIKAMFPGQVAFARFFKGYGNMVVVDHGHDVFSLVAGMSSIHVRVEQPVSMGTTLGVAGLEEEDGNVYLEIRVDGKPEDPKNWLQLDG